MTEEPRATYESELPKIDALTKAFLAAVDEASKSGVDFASIVTVLTRTVAVVLAARIAESKTAIPDTEIERLIEKISKSLQTMGPQLSKVLKE